MTPCTARTDAATRLQLWTGEARAGAWGQKLVRTLLARIFISRSSVMLPIQSGMVPVSCARSQQSAPSMLRSAQARARCAEAAGRSWAAASVFGAPGRHGMPCAAVDLTAC